MVSKELSFVAAADRGLCRLQLYLLLDVVERVGGIDGEANQDNVGIRVRERTETIVIFLASRIPKGQLDVLAVNLDVGDIVLENGGDVDLGVENDMLVPELRFHSCLRHHGDNSGGFAARVGFVEILQGSVVMHPVVGDGRR